jgi:hypothetical protein
VTLIVVGVGVIRVIILGDVLFYFIIIVVIIITATNVVTILITAIKTVSTTTN